MSRRVDVAALEAEPLATYVKLLEKAALEVLAEEVLRLRGKLGEHDAAYAAHRESRTSPADDLVERSLTDREKLRLAEAQQRRRAEHLRRGSRR